MPFKIQKKQINQFRNSGILKINNFFEKKEILTLKNNLIKRLKKRNSFECYYENLRRKRHLRRIEKLSTNSKDFYKILNNKDLKYALKKYALIRDITDKK